MRRSSKAIGWSLTATCLLGGCGPLSGMGSAVLESSEPDRGTPRSDASPPDALGGGMGAGMGTTSITAHSLSNEAIMALARDQTYRTEENGFRRVDRAPFASTVSPDKMIAMYVSENGYDAYTEISPDDVGSRASLPVGTVIVREVWGSGALGAITIMVQLEKGAFPLGGDFWYASLTPQGEVNKDVTSGEPQMGLSEKCGTCHLRR
ncbi:MAG: hypothetical protein ABW252_22215, partial [Polyangiales bacterium]